MRPAASGSRKSLPRTRRNSRLSRSGLTPRGATLWHPDRANDSARRHGCRDAGAANWGRREVRWRGIMAQGTRGRWLRVAASGFGVVLCSGLVGCWNMDKPKDSVGGGKPTPGLPGTPTLQPGMGNPAANKTGQPGGQFTGTGANLQPSGGMQPGAGLGQTRTGTNGLNTNMIGAVQPIDSRQPPSNFGGIGAPAQPGVTQPGGAGGPLGAAPLNPGSGTGAAGPAP